MPRRASACLVVVAVLLALAWARGLPQDASAQSLTVAWRGCGGGFECTTLSVPLDYQRPEGRQIELALIRQPARDPGKRIGVLLANPGGPGASGVSFTRWWAHSLAAEVRDRFDIIGFD